MYYTARKLKPTGKESWVIEFRHPLLKDNTGKIGRKVRKGLGAISETEADLLINQMNILLSDETFWKSSSKALASDKFNIGIVNAFYNELDYKIYNHENSREAKIPLKTSNQGYSQVLLLGATGAGKTTLLRQLMGTDPLEERFPATSAARTTVFDTEIILANGDYKGVVTFYSENETREMIKDSVRNAMTIHFITNDDSKVLRTFLEDAKQRFRLSYIIGKIKEKKSFAWEIEETGESNNPDTDSLMEEQEAIQLKINEYLQSIKSICDNLKKEVSSITDLPTSLSDEERKTLNELIETEIEDYNGDDFLELIEDILEEIKKRFQSIPTEQLVTEKFGWPKFWYKETNNREDFLQSIRFFSSNSSHLFGKLLTPLVSGMRVEGPFKPDFLNEIPKLVILDGEGLGHIAHTNSSLPLETLKKFDTADAIVLVDNAQNPMLAAPYAVIKSTAISGHYQKLILCFTHFDSVKGDNLPTIKDKIDHVFGSVDNVLEKLKTELEYDVKVFLSKHLSSSSYFLANLDDQLNDSIHSATISQIKKLITKAETSLNEESDINFSPTYEISALLFRIQNASKIFHNMWKAYLYGDSNHSGIVKAHFTQVKALSRRLEGSETGYAQLQPISDFWTAFQTPISNFLSSAIDWHPSNLSDEEKLRKTSEILNKISTKMQRYGVLHIKNDKINMWQNAYYHRGVGSAKVRAKAIEEIYLNAIPILSDGMTITERKFSLNMINIVIDSIKESGGKVTSIMDVTTTN